MRIFISFLFGFALLITQAGYSAHADCQSMTTEGEGSLIAAISKVGAKRVLQINFDAMEICSLESAIADIDGQASAAIHINTDMQELAVAANIEGQDTWLRIDVSYSEEMLIDRVTSESLRLTDAEFLGDNSLLEASEFFVEYLGSVLIGDFELRNVEVNIPHLDKPYDHYAGRGPVPASGTAAAEFLTVGSIGEALLEDMIVVVDVANSRMYMTSSR